jgi:hypothetical protein
MLPIRIRQLMCAATLALASGQVAALEIIVPAYFYPSFSGSYWDTLTAQAQLGTPITAIMNPGSGPGIAVNADYTAAVDAFRAAGGKVLGYVPTGYAGASVNASATCQPASGASYVVSDVVSCAQRYQTFYHVDGIFLDEFTNSVGSSELGFYRDAYAGVKAIDPLWQVVGNPGTDVPPEYLSATGRTADTIVSYEQANVNYPPSAGSAGPASAYAHLIYNVTDMGLAAQMIALAPSRNVGYIYVTSDNFCAGAAVCTPANSDGNPWDTLPLYFASIAEQVRNINAAVNGVPAPVGAGLMLLGLGLLARKRGRTSAH